MGPEKGKKVSRTIRFWRCVLLRYDIDRLDTRSIHSRYNMERCSTKPRRAWLSRFALWYVMSSFISAGYPSESPKKTFTAEVIPTHHKPHTTSICIPCSLLCLCSTSNGTKPILLGYPWVEASLPLLSPNFPISLMKESGLSHLQDLSRCVSLFNLFRLTAYMNGSTHAGNRYFTYGQVHVLAARSEVGIIAACTGEPVSLGFTSPRSAFTSTSLTPLCLVLPPTLEQPNKVTRNGRE